jgi:hypothetical protein
MNFAEIKTDFTILKDIIYMDSASTSLTPEPVLNAVLKYYREYNAKSADVSFKSLAERLKRSGEVRFNHFMLVFKERDKEISLFKDGRAIIKGTDDEKVARSLYARFVGI